MTLPGFNFNELSHLKCAYRGFRDVNMGSCRLRVLPYDRKFWDAVDAGEWEPETLQLYSSVISPGMQYCDIGAWIGPTVLYARHCGAHVTCIEPDPLAYERLLGNLRLNGGLDVTTFHCALARENGFREMGAMVGSLGKSATSLLGSAAAQKIKVPCVSWTSLNAMFSLPRFEFIKIDVEGGEVELLPEMMAYLKQHKPALLLSAHWAFLDEQGTGELCRCLAELSAIYRMTNALAGMEQVPVDLTNLPAAARPSMFFLRDRIPV